MKYRLLILLSMLAVNIYAQENIAFDGHKYKPSYFLDTPRHWGIERFLIPIQFAPSIPYKGIEDIRFTPGWAKKGSDACKEENKTFVFHQVSPKPQDDAVWTKRHALWKSLRCKK